MQIQSRCLLRAAMEVASLIPSRSMRHASTALTALPACLVLAGCGERTEEVATVPTQREANRLAMVLHDLSPRVESVATQRTTSYKISVPSGQVAEARLELARRGLPREPRAGLGSLAGSSLSIPTRSEERAKLSYALTEQLRGEIERLPFVVEASVMLVLPPEGDSILGKTVTPTKVSVVALVGEGVPQAGAQPATADSPIRFTQDALRQTIQELAKPIVGNDLSGVSVEVWRFEPTLGNRAAPVGSGGVPGNPAPADSAKPTAQAGLLDQLTAMLGEKGAVIAVAVVALLALGLVGGGYFFYRASRAKAD